MGYDASIHVVEVRGLSVCINTWYGLGVLVLVTDYGASMQVVEVRGLTSSLAQAYA